MTARDHLGIAGLEDYLFELGAEVRAPASPAFTVGPATGFAPCPAGQARVRGVCQPAGRVAFVEPAYAAQGETYATSRLPLWLARLDRVAAETSRIESALASRTEGARVAGSGESAVLVMPVPGGRCPVGGPLAYAYADLFQAAQANLRELAEEKPPRFTEWSQIERWYRLIADNIDLLLTASNIYPLFRFPEAVRVRGGSSRDEFGARETLRTSVGEAVREGRPYPSVSGWGMAAPQSVLDLEEGLLRNERMINRLPGNPMISTGTPSEECFFGGSCPRDFSTYHRRLDSPLRDVFRRYESSDHVRSRRSGISDFARSTYQSMFAPSTEQLSTGRVYFSPGGFSNFWQSMGSVFLPAIGSVGGRPITGRRYAYPINDLTLAQFTAREFSQISLSKMLTDAIGFYVFNHNVWYAEKLGLTPDQIRSMQRVASEAGLDAAVAPVLGLTGAVGALINPLIAIIVPLLNTVGKELLNAFIRFPTDLPKPLFLRVPDPTVCTGRPEEQAGSTLCPEGTTGVYPNCTSVLGPDGGTTSCPPGTTGTPPNCSEVPTRTVAKGGGGLVIGAAALLLLSRFLR